MFPCLLLSPDAELDLSLRTMVTAFLLTTSIPASKYCDQMLKVSEFWGFMTR
jgi:hypothetical protein